MKPLMSIASPSITGLPLAICCKPIIFLHSWVIIETISIIKHKKTSANLFLFSQVLLDAGFKPFSIPVLSFKFENQQELVQKLEKSGDYGGTTWLSSMPAIIGRFSNRMGKSVDDGPHKLNNWLNQSQSGKLGTGSSV